MTTTDMRAPAQFTDIEGVGVAEASAALFGAGEPTGGSESPDEVRDDNSVRAARAMRAVDAYASVCYGTDEEVVTALSDLLNDMRHLCDALGADYEAMNEPRHYSEEILGRE